MRVAITGSTGLLGQALGASLRADGHEVVPVVRSRAGPDSIRWQPAEGILDAAQLVGLDAVVHLAGEPIGARRWSEAVRREIAESRRLGTRLVAEAIASLDDKPALLSASAVGYYGSRGDEVLSEGSAPGDDFLAEVCKDWEAATQPAVDAGARVCIMRNGVVLADDGPLISKVRLPFSLGLGGRIGDGRQYIPWIGLEDTIRAIRFLLERDDLTGPFNLVSPTPVTNREFTKALGEVMRRPTVLPVPVLALRLLYGEMGVVLATSSQRVQPGRLLEAGFTFVHDEVVPALRAALEG
ncbi:MAG: TIGR01777 family oxidoreductase [Nitriliruptorales bacterium]|nr:TIGR01777 family oxidoreductase [Nitriliruptorales bacterium]